MFKLIALLACIAVVAAKPGLLAETHTIVQPAVLAKAAIVDARASSAITHQSYTNLVRKVPVAPVVPVVHTYAAPAPIIKTVSAPIVPVVKTVAAPIIAAPVVHSVPVVHSLPVVKTVVSSPLAYSLHH